MTFWTRTSKDVFRKTSAKMIVSLAAVFSIVMQLKTAARETTKMIDGTEKSKNPSKPLQNAERDIMNFATTIAFFILFLSFTRTSPKK